MLSATGADFPGIVWKNWKTAWESPLPAATQCQIMEETAVPLQPALEELKRQAAQGELVHNDDTSMRVLSLDRRCGHFPERTGVFTSGLVWACQQRRIALCISPECKHAGENLAEVLETAFSRSYHPPFQMCTDALSRNVPKFVETMVANCNAHSRRNFVKKVTPRVFRKSAGSCWRPWARSTATIEQALRAVAIDGRASRFHQEHSGPVMEKLHSWCAAQFEERKVEPNSGLGRTISTCSNTGRNSPCSCAWQGPQIVSVWSSVY